MAAWFLLPAAVAAVKGVGGYLQAKNQPIAAKRKHTAFKQKANTGYLKRYMADLRGRSGNRAKTELAMRPALRAIGAQQRQGQRQLAYQSAQQGLEGSGIEAQKQLALQAGTTQAVAGLGEKMALQAQSQAQQLQGAREGQRMKLAGDISRQEGAVSEANRRAQFQADQANIEEQRAYDQRVAQKEAAVKNAMIQGVAGVATSLAGGMQQQYAPMSNMQQQQIDQEMALKYPKAEGGIAGYQGGGVATSTPISEFLDVEITPKKDVLVDYLGNDPGYVQALVNYKTQQNEARVKQNEDKTKQFNLYQAKLDQIADIETSPRDEKWNTVTGKKETLPMSRSKKQKIRTLKKETEVEVFPPEEVKPYELTESDSSAVARSYLSNLAKSKKISFKTLDKSVDKFVEDKQKATDTRVKDLMTDIMEMAWMSDEGTGADIDPENLFELLRNPDFKSSSDVKANTKTVERVLKRIQEKREGKSKADSDRGGAKMNLIGNMYEFKGFFDLMGAVDVPATDDTPASTTEAFLGTDESREEGFEKALSEFQDLINFEGGIPFKTGIDEITGEEYQLNKKESYAKIVEGIRDIVDKYTVPISQLQAQSKDELKTKLQLLGFTDAQLKETPSGTWQVVGGDEKWRRTITNELTKDLHKPAMWKETQKTEGTGLQKDWWEE